MLAPDARDNFRASIQLRQWQTVRAWPGLRGEAKCAWSYVQELTGGRVDCTIEVHVAAIGVAVGGADAPRNGRRYIAALQSVGLVRVIDKDEGGLWTLHIENPLTVRRARLLPNDPQRRLFEEPADDEQQAESAPPPPDPCKSTSTYHIPITTPPPHRRTHVAGGERATSASTEPPSANLADGIFPREFAPLRAREQYRTDGDPIETVAGSIDAIIQARREHVASHPVEVDALVNYIKTAVNDPALNDSIARKIATEIVEGVYGRDRLDSVLKNLKRKDLSPGKRFAYFVVGMNNVREKVGLDRFGANHGRIDDGK